VDPGFITANRGQFLSLVRSNLFGQNAPAIAAAEAEYEEMSAQDVAAMFGYHTSASATLAQLGPWEQALENLSGLPGEFARTIGNPFALVQEIQHTPMTPAAGITGVANELFADIFGASAGLPIPATLGGTFTGKPSLVTKLEIAGLWGIKDFLGTTGLETQVLANPSSPFLALVASNAPGLHLFLGNGPPGS